NTSGSATGTGTVLVNSGTLGGPGIIAGPTTVSAGGFLAPGIGASQTVTLTIQSLLIFKSSSTYTCKLNTKKAMADQIAASRLTTESGPQFTLKPVGNKKPPPGQAFTVINNTAATPTSGTFANLADGETITIGRNTYQANYEAGDGNDLTLTVVP